MVFLANSTKLDSFARLEKLLAHGTRFIMNPHFLTNIHIKQFKCFTDFKAEGFKRVNLIGGKNNVGKTAFIEACYINVCAVISAICDVGYRRERILHSNDRFNSRGSLFEKIQIYLEYIQEYESTSNLNQLHFFIQEQLAEKTYTFEVNNKKLFFHSIAQLGFDDDYSANIQYIDSVGYNNRWLLNSFEEIQRDDKEDNLNKFINEFDNSISNFKVIGDKPQCKVNGQYRDITECGDGLLQYIAIICTLYAGADGYLFIDEIDKGLHYSQLDRLWEIIFTLSKQTNCQVFATTHSKEMLESFARVARKLDEHEISYTTLVRNKQNMVKALTLDYELLLISLDQAHEIR